LSTYLNQKFTGSRKETASCNIALASHHIIEFDAVIARSKTKYAHMQIPACRLYGVWLDITIYFISMGNATLKTQR
jgi:hypothetical protein